MKQFFREMESIGAYEAHGRIPMALIDSETKNGLEMGDMADIRYQPDMLCNRKEGSGFGRQGT